MVEQAEIAIDSNLFTETGVALGWVRRFGGHSATACAWLVVIASSS
jgi:hypothetical protein